MPISGSPKPNMNSTTVSGQLRMTVTHAVLKVRSGATGATRHVAMIVPSISEPTAPHRQMVSERRNPLQNRSRFWVMASICHLLMCSMGRACDVSGHIWSCLWGRSPAPATAPNAPVVDSAAGCGLGQGGRRGTLDLAGGVSPRLGVRGFVVLERLVDELA